MEDQGTPSGSPEERSRTATDDERGTDRSVGSERDRTVLVVEDDTDLAETYALWLREEFDVVTAHGGREALEMCDETVDVVALDRRMPSISGEAVLRRLHARESTFEVAIVSAVSPAMDAMSLPHDAYLRKPVDRETFLDAIADLCNSTPPD